MRYLEMQTIGTTAAPVLFVILVLASRCSSQPCNENLRTRVEPWEKLENGSLLAGEQGDVYPEGTYWLDGDVAWGCPCLLGNCIRMCSQGLINASGDEMIISLSRLRNSSSTIKLWEGEEQREAVLNKHFKVLKDARCLFAWPLEPKEFALDDFRILANGSLFYSHPNISESLRIVSPENFCIVPMDEEDARVLACNDTLAEPASDLKYYIYPPLFIVSAFFLLLTLIAFFLSPEFNNLHGRSMACQAGSLLIMYLGMTLIYLTGATVHITVCITTALINYYFLLASFLWLNVMCIDIYFTFRGTIAQRPEINFLYPSLYAWGSPALMVILILILDNTTQDETFSPGIGVENCWFQGIWSSLLYFNGPVLILLVLNVVLFSLTAMQLWRLKREAARAFKSSSIRVVTPAGNRQHKDRFTLYIKLFLLMGVTWIMEVVSWAIGGPDSIWYITDTVNCLRGVLIFWFCVWCNKNVRKVFLDAFSRCWCKRSTQNSSMDAAHGSSLSTDISAL